MHFLVGTSGYSIPKWKGKFYPEKLPAKQMLSYYGQQLPAVEINSSFYRMPKASTLELWVKEVPGTFRFAIKAPQTITHRKRLNNVEVETKELLRITSVLKRRRGPLLFQLPPNFKKDLPRLKAFIRLIGRRTRAAFEFRHESWFDDEVFDCLRTHSCALCIADADELPAPGLVATAGWGYVRLRREGYSDRLLRQWINKIKSQAWNEAYVFFKHEDTGIGPKLAARFLELAAR
jgi:uncharacterized protein YecE (DUF72 family)